MIKMEFESLPTTPTADELIDRAFSRAARAGRAKEGLEAQDSMLQTASNVLSDNLEHIVRSWPDFDTLSPFYRDLADVIVGIDSLRTSLSEIGWADRKTAEIGREYRRRIQNTDPDTARKLRKQAFARLADIVTEVEEDLNFIDDARNELKELPEIRPDDPTIVITGFPNVGKSAFVNAVTRATNDVDEYPFTTTQINVGHLEHKHIRYQLVDTPGVLDRPTAERNAIEQQALSALRHVADLIVVMVDPSETCGYPIDEQLALRDEIKAAVDVPIITVSNKADLSTDVEAEYYISVTHNEALTNRKAADSAASVSSLEALVTELIETIDVDLQLPLED